VQPTPATPLLSGDIFAGGQAWSQTLTYYDSPFTVLEGTGDRAASSGLRFDVRQGIPGADWALDEQLAGVSAASAWTNFQNAAFSQAVVTEGAVANAIEYWSGGAPGWYGVSERGRVALHYYGELRPAQNRQWFHSGVTFDMCLALGGNGYCRVDVGTTNVFDGPVTEAGFLTQGLSLTDPFTVDTGTTIDVYYVQTDAAKGWGGFVAKAVPGVFDAAAAPEERAAVLRDAPVLSCGLFDTAVPVPPKTVEFFSDLMVTSERGGKAAEASFQLPLVNPQMHDGNGWEWHRDLVDTSDPGSLRFHRGNISQLSFDMRRQRLVTVDVTAGANQAGTLAPTPESNDLGQVILDYNSRTLVRTDGERITSWTDDSGDGHTGFTAGDRAGPIYRATGFDGADVPYAEILLANAGWMSPTNYPNNETLYLFVDDLTGAGSGDPAANLASIPGQNGENYYLKIQGDGRLYLLVGTFSFPVSATGTVNVADGASHIIRLTHNRSSGSARVFVDGVEDISIVGQPIVVNQWSGATIYFGPSSLDTNRMTGNIQRVLRYNKAHETAGLNAVEGAVIAGQGPAAGSGGGRSQTYRVFSGFIQDMQGVSTGTATVLLQDAAQRLLETFDKNFPDRIDYISRNHKRRRGAVEPIYDIPAFDNWSLETAIENLAWRCGLDPSRTRQPLSVATSGVGAVPVLFQAERFQKFRARAMNNKPIRLARPVHYGNYGSAFQEVKPPDDPYLFPPENTKEVWGRMRDLSDRYGYDLRFDEYGDLCLRSTNNPHWVYNADLNGSTGATAGAAAEAYAGTYLDFAAGGSWTGTVQGARLDVSVGRGVSFGSWSYTVTRVSDSVVVASDSFSTAAGREEFFYDYAAATDGINSTVLTLYSGDFDTYTVTMTGTGHVRLDAVFPYHTDPLTTKLPRALGTDNNAYSIRAQDTMADMRNFVIVVGRRKANVTDSEKLDHNPNNPEQEFIVAAAVDKTSITDPTSLRFIGSIKGAQIYSDTIGSDDFAQYIARVFIYRYANPKVGATVEHTMLPMVQLLDVVNAQETRYATVDSSWPLWVQKITHKFGGRPGQKWTTTLETSPYPEYPSFEPRNDIDIDVTFEGRPAINVTVDYTSLTGDTWVNPDAKAVVVSKDVPYNAGDGAEPGDLVETAAITLSGVSLDLSGYPWPPVPGTVQIKPVISVPTGLQLKDAGRVIENQTLKIGARILAPVVMDNFQAIKQVRLTAKQRTAGGLFLSLAALDLTTNGNDNANGFYYQLIGTGRTKQIAIHRKFSLSARPFDDDKVVVSVDLQWYQGQNHTFDEWLTNYPYGHFFDVDYAGKSVALNWQEGTGAAPYTAPLAPSYKVRYRRLGPTDGGGNFADPYASGSPFYDPYTSELGYLVRVMADFLITGYYRVSVRSAADPTTVVAWLTEPASDAPDPEAHWTFYNAGSGQSFFWDGSDTIGEYNVQQSLDYAEFANAAFEQDQKPIIGKGFYAWNRERDGGRLGPLALISGEIDGDTGAPAWGSGAQGTYSSWVIWIEATNDELEDREQLVGRPAVRRVASSDLNPAFQNNGSGSTSAAYIHTHLPTPNRVELTVEDWDTSVDFSELDLTGDTGPDSTTQWFTDDTDPDYGFLNNYKPVRIRFTMVPRPGVLWPDELTGETAVKLTRVAHLKALIHDQFVTYDGASFADSRTEARTIYSRRLANDSNTVKNADAGWRKGKDFKNDVNADGVAEWVFLPKYFKKDWFGTVEEPIEFGNYRQLEEVPKWDPAQDVGGPRSRLQLAFIAYLFYLSVYAQDRSGRFTWGLRPDFVDTSKLIQTSDPVEWPDDPDRQHRRTVVCRQWTDERVADSQTWVDYQTEKWDLGGTVGAKLLKHFWGDHDPASTTLAGASWPTLSTDLWSNHHRSLGNLNDQSFPAAAVTRQLGDGDLGLWTFEDTPTWFPSVSRDFFPYQLLPPMFEHLNAQHFADVGWYYTSVDVSPYNGTGDKSTGSDQAKGDVWSSGVWDMTESNPDKQKFFPGTTIQPKNPPLTTFSMAAAGVNNADYARQDDAQHYEEYRGIFSRGPRPGEQPKRTTPILPYFVNPMVAGGMKTQAALNNPVYPLHLVTYTNHFAVRFRGEYVWESAGLFPTDQYGVLLPALVNHERCRFADQFAARAAARFDTGAWVGWKDDLTAAASLVWNSTGETRAVFDSGYMPVGLSTRVSSNQEAYFHLLLINERRGVPAAPNDVAGGSTVTDSVAWNPAGPVTVTAGTYVSAVPTAYNATSDVILDGRFTYSVSPDGGAVVTDQAPARRGVSVRLTQPGTVTVTATHSVTGESADLTITAT
jgi:hypothetical protein